MTVEAFVCTYNHVVVSTHSHHFMTVEPCHRKNKKIGHQAQETQSMSSLNPVVVETTSWFHPKPRDMTQVKLHRHHFHFFN